MEESAWSSGHLGSGTVEQIKGGDSPPRRSCDPSGAHSQLWGPAQGRPGPVKLGTSPMARGWNNFSFGERLEELGLFSREKTFSQPVSI